MATKWWDDNNLGTGNLSYVNPMTYEDWLRITTENAAKKGWTTTDFSYLPVSNKKMPKKNNRAIVPDTIIASKYRRYSGYIRDLLNDRTIGLASTPDSVDESISSSVSNENPVGAAQPVIIYTGTGARQMNIGFKVYQDYLPAEFKDVKSYCTAIKQLVYPKIDGDYIKPPECEFYMPGIHIIGICQSVSVSWGGTVRGGSPDNANISLSILETQKVVGGVVNV